MIFFRKPLVIVLFSWMFLSSTIPGSAAEPVSADLSRIYLIRGVGGMIPPLQGPVRQQFESKGLEVVSFKFTQKAKASREIERAHRDGELKGGIIIVGYSLGGCSALRVCRMLEKRSIPVKMLFLIEVANPFQTVPSNVEECFNFYRFPALIGKSIKADSERTFLVNCEAYQEAGFGIEYTHFVIPFFERVHDLISNEVVAAIREESPGGGEESFFQVKSP